MKVLVLCHSPWLSHYLKGRYRFATVVITHLNGLKIASRRAGIEAFDALIVDEGQDLLYEDFFTAVNIYLKGGIQQGRWVFFHDINHQAGLFGKVETNNLKKLETHSIATIPLKRNCRNTLTILEYIQEKTKADMGVKGAGYGPEVKVTALTSKDDLFSALERILNEMLEDGGLSYADITILVEAQEEKWAQKLKRISKYPIKLLDRFSLENFPSADYISLTSIKAFKGLENKTIILLVYQNQIVTQEALASLYVGMSRANMILNIVSFLDLENNIQ